MIADPANHAVFAGRDVAVVNVCRGLWRRPQAMLVRWVEACGGRVVGARAFENPGREPIRLFSLFCFLGAGRVGRPAFLKGILTPQFLSDDGLNELEKFGRALAQRPAVPAPHLVLAAASRASPPAFSIALNAADDVTSGEVYLTVTGSSAEAGDDGEVGRGNRVNGLITPYRPMTMEAAAGKNPVSHDTAAMLRKRRALLVSCAKPFIG